MYNRNYGGFYYVRIHSEFANVCAKPNIINLKPVTDGYKRPSRQIVQHEGSLITFGFNFGEYDDHIVDAINIAAKMGKKVYDKLWSVYIGVYSDEALNHILEIKNKFKCKVTPYNARTAKIW